MQNSLSYARQLDTQDPLKKFRDQFIIPSRNGEEQIYFLGNSLGLQPKTTQIYIHQVMDQWSQYGVESFFDGSTPWFHYHDRLIKPLAKIVGAQNSEVVVMNQLSVNLHLMMVSFYRPAGKRNKIICEAKAFPSDQYMLETHLKYCGLDPTETIIEISPRDGEHIIRTEDILFAINKHKDELALVLWGGVNYYTGQFFDMQTITTAAHDAGAIAGFDLAHAVGNVPLLLHNWEVDFACWCSYKYLNSGPGAVGGVFIHEKHHNDQNIPRFAGWWGYDKNTRFKMEKGFKAVLGAEGWQLSTPSMLLFASHLAALEIFEEAGMDNIFHKGKMLNEYLFFILNDTNKNRSEKLIEILTPAHAKERGNQVSMFMLSNGKEIFERLGKNGIFADWREPDVIRIAPAPLYNTFEEVWRFGQQM